MAQPPHTHNDTLQHFATPRRRILLQAIESDTCTCVHFLGSMSAETAGRSDFERFSDFGTMCAL